MEVNFYDSANDGLLKFAVIIAIYKGRFVFCKHRDRDTYEIPGGHREAGETILETAARELEEETGAVQYKLKPVCVYSVREEEAGQETFGLLCYAEIAALREELTHEIGEIILTRKMPHRWTYPEIQPRLMEYAEKLFPSMTENAVSAREGRSLSEKFYGGEVEKDGTERDAAERDGPGIQKSHARRCSPDNCTGTGDN